MPKTLGDIAIINNVPIWTLRRLCRRGILPEPTRAGGYRVFEDSDLPAIRKALRAAGYVKQYSMPRRKAKTMRALDAWLVMRRVRKVKSL